MSAGSIDGTLSVANRLPARAERGDRVEQPVLRFRRQVAEQALGAPRRRLARVEAGLPSAPSGQSKRRSIATARRSAVGSAPMSASVLRLELDHLRLVHLVDDGALRPLQPVGPGVQARRQDHHLPDACVRSLRVKKSSKNFVRTAMLSTIRSMPVASSSSRSPGLQLAGRQPREQVDADRTHQRLGVRIVDQRRHRCWSPPRAPPQPSSRSRPRWRPDPMCRCPYAPLRPLSSKPSNIYLAGVTSCGDCTLRTCRAAQPSVYPGGCRADVTCNCYSRRLFDA